MKLIRSRTLPTSSDHRAVVATYDIDGEWLRVGTWNVGDGPTRAKAEDLAELCDLVDVLALQEVGDRDLPNLLPRGWVSRKRARVALCWRADLPPYAPIADRLLSEKQWAGPGAGPDTVGEKVLVGARWIFGGEVVAIGCVHLVASQHMPGRRALAKRQVAEIAAWVDAKMSHHVVVLGDFNAVPTSSVLDPLRAAGLTRAVAGPTHGKRAIDHIWTRVQTAPPVPEETPAMTFIEAHEWGANASKDATRDSHPIGSTLGVTLHWTGPAVGIRTHADCAGKVRAIERHHEYGNGWGDIAYNLLVCPHGYIYEGRGAWVRSAANGDTAANSTHYAVCYLGGEGEPFTDAGKAGMIEAVRYLRREGGAGPQVNGHRDHKATACPGAAIYSWLRSANFDAGPTPRPAPKKRRPKWARAAIKPLRERRKVARSKGLTNQTRKLREAIKYLRAKFPRR